MPPEQEEEEQGRGGPPPPPSPSRVAGPAAVAAAAEEEEEEVDVAAAEASNDGGGGSRDDDGGAAFVDDEAQTLLIVRHGDRWDYEDPSWNSRTERPGDPPLSALGHRQAREAGRFVGRLLASTGIDDGRSVTWLSSPFLRTLQTSDDMISELAVRNADQIRILPEPSVFEWDGKEDGRWHASLPPLEERWCYFPRLDLSHEPLFVPDLPEPRSRFLARCERAVEALGARYPPPPRGQQARGARSAVVVVTHAAGCVAMCRSATRLPLDRIEPAAPCGVYRMTRPSSKSGSDSTPKGSLWKMDPAVNGSVAHLSDLGRHTAPWNHFGSGGAYTGPPGSLLAPEPIRREWQAERKKAKAPGSGAAANGGPRPAGGEKEQQ